MKTAISSMTGFVSKTIELPPAASNKPVLLTLTLKSLNARFFEVNWRLPQALSPLEVELTSRARAQLKRGSLTINATVSDVNYFKMRIQASLSTIGGYIQAIKEAQKEFDIPGQITVDALLQLPNLFVAEDGVLTDTLKNLVFGAFDQALGELKQIRLQEGSVLLQDLLARTAKLEQLIVQVRELFELAFEEHQKEVSEQIVLLQQSTSETSQQQRMQLQLELDRLDVHEEITRFNTHLQAFYAILTSSQEEKGRQLDFILQELGREINTLSAKCANSQMSADAVAIKVELEKCREQVQNIV